MKKVFFLLFLGLSVLFFSCTDNHKEIDTSMIVKTWKLASIDTEMPRNSYTASLLNPIIYHYVNDEIKFGTTLEFNKDGSYVNNTPNRLFMGTYSINEDQLSLHNGGGSSRSKIISLTQNTLKIEVDLTQEIQSLTELSFAEAKVILIFICTNNRFG